MVLPKSQKTKYHLDVGFLVVDRQGGSGTGSLTYPGGVIPGQPGTYPGGTVPGQTGTYPGTTLELTGAPF